MNLRDAVKQALRQGSNVAILGQGGCGKTQMLREYIAARGRNKVAVVAYTAKAASLLDGALTVNSYFEINPMRKTSANDVFRQMSVYKLMTKYKAMKQGKKMTLKPWTRAAIAKFCAIDAVAIDECSMMNEELMNVVHATLQGARECKEPFGGAQVILLGDFHQLPPVHSKKHLFQTDIWRLLKLKTFLLTTNFRAVDPEYRKMLDEMWKNELSADAKKKLREHSKVERPVRLNEVVMRVRNADADAVNETEFNCLGDGKESVVYEAVASKTKLDDPEPVPESWTWNSRKKCQGMSNEEFRHFQTIEREMTVPCGGLKLKPECKVMLRKNVNVKEKLVNGAVGVVTSVEPTFAHVKFPHADDPVKIEMESWTRKIGDVEYSLRTMPLILSWAITVHKSQGSKYERVRFACDATMAQPGMAITAFSRAVSFEGLTLEKFDESNIVMDPMVCGFYKELLAKQREKKMYDEGEPQDDVERVDDLGTALERKRKRPETTEKDDD